MLNVFILHFLTTIFLPAYLLASGFCENSMEPWGCDSELAFAKKDYEVKTLPKEKVSIPAKMGLSMIRFFQRRISPIDGPRSSYYPSSSEYAFQAIRKYGLINGFILGCDRLLRENGEQWIYKTSVYYDRPVKVDPVR